MQRTKTKSTKKRKLKKGERRYPKGKHSIYDSVFEQAVNASPVLNPTARNINNDHWNHPNTALYLLQGDPTKDDHYQIADGGWKPSLIKTAKEDLKDAHQRFENWAREQVRTGKSLKKPTKWPEPFLELRLKREAVLDARYREVAHIKKQQAEKEAEKEAERIANILPNGTLGIMKDDSIDGQKISYTADDIPFIDEPHSKYHGMPLFWYNRMANKWVEENGLSNYQLLDERNRLHEEERAEAYEKGLTPPATPKAFKNFKREKFATISEADFPEWPSDAKPINEIGK